MRRQSHENFMPAFLMASRLAGVTIDPVVVSDALSAHQLEALSPDAVDAMQQVRDTTNRIFSAIGFPEPDWDCAIDEATLPLVYFSPKRGWGVVHGRNARDEWLATEFASAPEGSPAILPDLTGLLVFAIPAESQERETAAGVREVIKRAVLKHRGSIVDAAVASILINILALATSVFSMQVYDRVIPTGGLQTLLVLSLGVALSLAFDLIIKAARAKVLESATVDWDREFSTVVFRRLMAIRVDHLPRVVGTLSAQLRGYETIRAFLTSAFPYLSVDLPFAFVFIVVIGLIGGPYVAAAPGAFLILSLAIGLFFKRKIEMHAQEGMLASNRKTGLLVEAVGGAETIKAAGDAGRMLSRWRETSLLASRHEFENRSTNERIGFVSGTCQQVSYVLLVAIGAYMAVRGDITMGAVIACSIVSGRVLAPTAMIPSMLVQWANAKAALKGLEAVWALPTDNGQEVRPLLPETIKGKLRLEEVSFNYPEAQPVLRVQRLEIRPGEKVGVVGAVGAGKSTLLRLLSGLHAPSSGRVFLDDMDIGQISRAFLSEHIGFLQQEVQLFSGTLRDNLIMGLPDPGDEAILKAAELSGLAELIGNHPKGLWLSIAEGGAGLSGGQRQLVGMTRLLLRRPSMWLLDEPTASMDERLERRSIDALRQSIQTDQTLILVTHKPIMLSLVSRLIVVAGHGIVADGPTADVLRSLQPGAAASTGPRPSGLARVVPA